MWAYIYNAYMYVCVFVYTLIVNITNICGYMCVRTCDEEALKECMMFGHFARILEGSRIFEYLKIIFRFSAVKNILYLKLNSLLTFTYLLEE